MPRTNIIGQPFTVNETPNWPKEVMAPPPEGPLQLGQLLMDPVKCIPLGDKVAPIPEEDRMPDCVRPNYKRGFTYSQSSFSFGRRPLIQALVCAERVEIKKFMLQLPYVTEVMNLPAVKAFMYGCKNKLPFYIVTGLTVCRGATVEVNDMPDETGGKREFILGYEVFKIWYDRGEIRWESYNKNAVMIN